MRQELRQKLKVMRAKIRALQQEKGPQALADYYRHPEQIARLARNSMLVDRPELRDRL